MWIFLNDAALSVVAHRDDAGCLLVRARMAGDIERVFPQTVLENAGTDYRYRATVPRQQVADRIADSIAAIDYRNFKNSCGPARHDAYLHVWKTWWKAAQSPELARE
jgi:hypothetical protein